MPRAASMSCASRAEDRVRDSVVDVQDVEFVEFGDLGHARGEGEIVGWVLEERVIRDRDLRGRRWSPRGR